MKVVAVSFAQQRYSQLWHRVVWQMCTDISEYHQGDKGGRFFSDSVTYLLAKVTSNIIITTLRTSDLIVYDTQQVLEILAKIGLLDCKFRYLIVVWGHMVACLVQRFVLLTGQFTFIFRTICPR